MRISIGKCSNLFLERSRTVRRWCFCMTSWGIEVRPLSMQVMEKFLPTGRETSMASGAFSMQEKRRFWSFVVGLGVIERAEFKLEVER